MADRQQEFSNMMNHIYLLLRLMNKHNTPHRYGTEDELYLNEVHTLKCIQEHPGISLSELGEYTYRTKGATSMMINKLESKGLVSKTPSPADIRRYCLTLTTKGRRVNEAFQRFDVQRCQDILHFFPSESAGTFHRTNEVLLGLIRYFLQY